MKQKEVIYQLLPRLFGNLSTNGVPGGSIEQNGCGRFNDLTREVLIQFKDLGVTHLWLTGIIRHATGTDYSREGLPASHPGILKGKAGSPYAINDYFDLDPDLAVSIPDRFDEFEDLVARIREAGLKVILDFVPNHVARDYASRSKPTDFQDLGEGDNRSVPFHPDNNFYYLPGTVLNLDGFTEEPARATGNDVFHPHPQPYDWYETVKLNYGVDYRDGRTFFNPVPDTWRKMTDILLFWASKGIDGFRCDMAGMVPVPFWTHAIRLVKREYPNLIFIAELYQPNQYEGFINEADFDYLYDKAGFYDTVREVFAGRRKASDIPGLWQSLQGFDNRMLRFLENHDEQRLASKEFAGDPWIGLPGLAMAAFMNNGPVLIYSGQEFGERADPTEGSICAEGRTTIFEYSFVPTIRNWLTDNLSKREENHFRATRQILSILYRFPVFSNGQFYDLSYANPDLDQGGRICSFLRYFEVAPERRETEDWPGLVLVSVCFDRNVRSARVRIPSHALEVTGLASRERLLVRGMEPATNTNLQLLNSQIVSSGIEIDFNPSGWCLTEIS